ncbi:MAG: Fe-S cluster assembly ATPase SufC [Patescibacteria group bacterium]|nr:Fe-S cluster assembly ATPase SufC [Patescibacteria group bacterium]
MSTSLLNVRNLKVSVGGKAILFGVSLKIIPGELHVLMGPNGSGKSTLAKALAGDPAVHVTGGSARFAGKSLLTQAADVRARAGLFLSFQYPVGMPGLSLSHFLTAAVRERKWDESAVARELPPMLNFLQLPSDVFSRDVNEGLSGGEKKRSEIAQLGVLLPKLAVLDEPDSGLDVDALQALAKVIDRFHRQGMAMLLITHYSRLLKYLRPDAVHVMVGGKLVKSGGPHLAEEIEQRGYEPLLPPV